MPATPEPPSAPPPLLGRALRISPNLDRPPPQKPFDAVDIPLPHADAQPATAWPVPTELERAEHARVQGNGDRNSGSRLGPKDRKPVLVGARLADRKLDAAGPALVDRSCQSANIRKKWGIVAGACAGRKARRRLASCSAW